MNLIQPAIGRSGYFPHAVLASRRWSGCDVYPVTSEEGIIKDAIVCDVRSLNLPIERLIHKVAHAQIRWFMTLWVVNKFDLKPPYYCPDWDVLTFWDVREHINSLANNDILHVFEPEQGVRSAAYVICTRSVLEDYCGFLREYMESEKTHYELSDMFTWKVFEDNRELSLGNLAEEFDGGVFDTNICVGNRTYEFEDEAKKIYWIDRKPYFKRLSDGKLIKAREIHCWGKYKALTGKLLAYAGITE